MGSADEYKATASQLDAMVKRGTMMVVQESAPLYEIVHGTTWPGDFVENTVACTRCHELFRLSADTYHGNANWSGPLDRKAVS